jgi:hypothetical protein
MYMTNTTTTYKTKDDWISTLELENSVGVVYVEVESPNSELASDTYSTLQEAPTAQGRVHWQSVSNNTEH